MKWLNKLVLLLGLMLPFVGCESSSSDSGSSDSQTANIEGSWSGSTVNGSMSMVITQDGNSVEGSIVWHGTYINGSAEFSGEVNGNELTGSYTLSNGVTGTIEGSIDGNTISGTWTDSNGRHASFTITLT